jgi:hypothetical protein
VAATLTKFFFGVAGFAMSLMLGRLRTVAVALLALVPVAALTTALLGPERWADWIAVASQRSTGGESTLTAYQTLNSLFGHLLRYDAEWNPAPVADVPIAARALWVAAIVGVVVLTALAARRVRGMRSLLPLALLLPASVLVAPVAEDQHFVLLLPSLLVAATLLVRDDRMGRRRWAACAAWAVAVVFLAPAWPYNRQSVEGWSTLLFYPRVYGTLILWGLIVWLALRHPGASCKSPPRSGANSLREPVSP